MRKQVLLFMFVNLCVGHAVGQPVSVGVKAGVPFIDQTGPGNESRPYLVGPSVEVRLPAGFAIEADALYQRIGSTSGYLILPGTSVSPPLVTSLTTRVRGNSWEFPVLGKYYFRSRAARWQPFLATGWSMRTIGFSNNTSETVVTAGGAPQTVSFRSHRRSGLDVGAPFAAGIRLHVGRLAITPEVRYTRWSSQNSLSRRNEAGFLLGLSF